MERITYPEQIEKAALDLAEVQREAAEQRERLAEIESILTLEIAGAKSPEGKPLYSNEAVRSAELILRLRDSEARRRSRDCSNAPTKRRRGCWLSWSVCVGSSNSIWSNAKPKPSPP